MADETVETGQGKDEALLKEVRDRYRYASDMWREQREHRTTLIRYLCGRPWSDEERKAREDAKRPVLSHDELNQYINQCVNHARQNKRGIKIDPAGNGANDKTAEFRQDLARTIEYRSNAPSIYLQAFQDAVEGSYGFCRVSRRYVSDDEDADDHQEIVIRPIVNPDSVLYDPDCKEPDWSDARFCFVLDPMSREEFKRKYPKAEVRDFGPEDMRVAPDWIQDKTVLVAEYWRIETKRVRSRSGKREIEKKTPVQYLTNGVEVLERNGELGTELPVIPWIGLSRYVDEGSGPRRKLFGLASFALDPQMTLAYLVSQEAEEAGLTPKSPYVGYKGQFDSDAEAWETATKVAHAFLQADPIVDGAEGKVLPLPRREHFTPNFQAYEVAKDSARRAIQAAMGISPLPTAAQRNNEKSGIALQRIQAQQEVGSYHFMDGFERALSRIGRIINSWIPKVYADEDREMALHKPDDSRRVVRINTAEPYVDEKTQEQMHFRVDEGDHDVTVSSGPSASSQREAASEFLDLLVGNLGNLPVQPPQAAKLLSLAIQMKQLGPKGDEMAEIISPTDQEQPLPPQAQQFMAKAQQQIQALNAYAQQVEKEKQELQQKLDAHVVENEYRVKIEQMKIEAQLAVAEINTKAQSLEERLKFVEDMARKLTDQSHEADMQARQHAQDASMQEQQQMAAADQQASQQAHETAQAEQAAQQQQQAEQAAQSSQQQ